jgi:uncharacterized protein (TIRG00374 family)
LKQLGRVAVAAIVIAALAAWAMRSLDVGALAKALRAASPGWVGLATLVAAACLPFAARRGWLLLGALSSRPIAFRDYLALHVTTSAANAWLAPPAGEVLRVLQLVRRRGHRLGAAACAQLADRLVDGAVMAAAAALLWLVMPMPDQVSRLAHLVPVTLLALVLLRAPSARGRAGLDGAA